jgi:hypothetical protein
MKFEINNKDFNPKTDKYPKKITQVSYYEEVSENEDKELSSDGFDISGELIKELLKRHNSLSSVTTHAGFGFCTNLEGKDFHIIIAENNSYGNKFQRLVHRILYKLKLVPDYGNLRI